MLETPMDRDEGISPIAMSEASIGELARAMQTGALTSERLIETCLERVMAYDQQGPGLNAVISLNPGAMAIARALDAERAAGAPRSPLHGIPVVLKDNFDTRDMPTTAGSLLLDGSAPREDAAVVATLRRAGAVILAKVNMGEFASGFRSSLGGQSRNPHHLAHSPSGSSGGTGVAIAAAYAPLGMGSDTGGSIRGPASVNGVVGLKPTHGLLSLEGIVPLGPSLDTIGPMARSVSDVAIALEVLTAVGASADSRQSLGWLSPSPLEGVSGLRGKTIGVGRDFMGLDAEVDAALEAAFARLRDAGATLVDVAFPTWFLASSRDAVRTIYLTEFPSAITRYLARTQPQFPKSAEDLISRAAALSAATAGLEWPEHLRTLKGDLGDPDYLALRNYYMPMSRDLVDGLLSAHRLDAIAYPPIGGHPALIDAPAPRTTAGHFPTSIANLTGHPDLTVPVGVTKLGLPVGMSILGRAFQERSLLELGFGLEQALQWRPKPSSTPPLASEHFSPS